MFRKTLVQSRITQLLRKPAALAVPLTRTQNRFFSSTDRSTIRNLAIIAHVDHGKTTLVDCLLRQTNTTLDDNEAICVMDSNELEQERGITILSKCTTIQREQEGVNYQLNIVDTPGHADFGGEVERIMSMVDGCCLVVDATDGPMTQTRFVLSKALAQGLKPIVVINKVDRESAAGRVGEVEGEVFDLFDSLGATNDQLDFPYVFASAMNGWAVNDMSEEKKDMNPLFKMICDYVPPPKADGDKPFSMLISQVDSHPFFGTLLVGRIHTGKTKVGDILLALAPDGSVIEEVKLMKIMRRNGLSQVNLEEGEAGDIVGVAGFDKATVTATLVAKDSPVDPIPSIPIDPPTLSMIFGTNSSPLAGKEGTKVTAQSILTRLNAETRVNVSLHVEPVENGEAFKVSGRGEMQLGVLIETMRREGFELSVSAPTVVYKIEDGEKLEPMEEVILDVNEDKAPLIIEKLSLRKGEMQDYEKTDNGMCRLTFHIPTRGLIGYRSEFIFDTRGEGVMQQIFHGYEPYKGFIQRSQKGALISQNSGKTNTYALGMLEARGTLFVGTNVEVYSGMVVGDNSRAEDIECNPCRSKQLTNMRSSGTDEKTRLAPPKQMTLEDSMAAVRDDELIEVTPTSIRLRKIHLDPGMRKRFAKSESQKRGAEKAKKKA